MIVVPSQGPESWQRLLAKPDLHWARGFSARTLAFAWEAAVGQPPEVETILAAAFGPVRPLVVVPEHKTPLPGGQRESQSDVFVLARHADGLIACTVEGKVDEPFGPTVAQQMSAPSPGKRERLDYLCALLGIAQCPPTAHYQLLHRTASALIEADRFHARDAAMIVHSFSPERRWFDAFAAFAHLLGHQEVRPGTPLVSALPGDCRLLIGWACGEARFRDM